MEQVVSDDRQVRDAQQHLRVAATAPSQHHCGRRNPQASTLSGLPCDRSPDSGPASARASLRM